ncbi:helix-turn-helix domain-containing protein [Streptomyces sp. NPDC085466]|uniref:helix-turn-helix domain-containing protein n=1 Tax=Streptomyces sp. NPDC085466 TaxID=3365725 RepID=UPI0037D09A37
MCHERTRLTRNFTVLDNALLQHKVLGGVAIGVASYIASLPEGTRVDIRTLANDLRLGRKTIATALNTLEAHGYLRRTVLRTPDGRVSTHTVFCHRPPQALPQAQPPAEKPEPPQTDEPTPAPAPAPTPTPTPEPDPNPEPPKSSPRRPLPPVPHPGFPARELLRAALLLLIGLRETDPRLYCSEADAEHLTPGVAAWLERGASPEIIRRALTADLPMGPLRRPASLLAHRLATHLPPAPPLEAPPQTPGRPHPLQYCEPCDTCFRAPASSPCPTCRNPDTSPAAYTRDSRLPSRC